MDQFFQLHIHRISGLPEPQSGAHQDRVGQNRPTLPTHHLQPLPINSPEEPAQKTHRKMSAGPEREKQWRQGWEREFCRAWFPALTNYNMQWVIPYYPFPAFPSWSPSHPVFPPPQVPNPGLGRRSYLYRYRLLTPEVPFLGPGIGDQSRTSSVSSTLGHFRRATWARDINDICSD